MFPLNTSDLFQTSQGADRLDAMAARQRRRTTRYEFVPDPALQPDPVYMGLRLALTTGPIGALRDRINRWREAREEHSFDRKQANATAAEMEPMPTEAGDDSGRLAA